MQPVREPEPASCAQVLGWDSCTVSPLPIQWAPKPEGGQLEQAEQCPPGGIAVRSQAWAFTPGPWVGEGVRALLRIWCFWSHRTTFLPETAVLESQASIQCLSAVPFLDPPGIPPSLSYKFTHTHTHVFCFHCRKQRPAKAGGKKR